MLAPELLERLALMQDPWQHHAPTLAAPWRIPLHGVHEWVMGGPIDQPPMHAFLGMLGTLGMLDVVGAISAAVDPHASRADGAGPCVAWIGQSVMPSAVVMHRWGMDLRHHVQIPGARTPAERLWAFEEAARSGRCLAIIVDAGGWNAAMSRRAQLASSWQPDRMPVLALAWRPQQESTVRSACTTRWLVQPLHDPADGHARPAWRISTLRDRRGTPAHDAARSILREPDTGARTMPWAIAS
jgi:hypothetical protein